MGEPLVRFVADKRIPHITRATQHQEYMDLHPNFTLKAEFDLIEQIYQLIKEADIQVSFQHVKGHQDDLKKHTTNCHSKLNSTSKPTNLRKTFTEFIFSINGTTTASLLSAVLEIKTTIVTNDFRTQLQKAWMESIYHNYLEQKFNWRASASWNKFHGEHYL